MGGGIGLSRKEIKEVRRIWGIVTGNVGEHPGQHGVEILLVLFATYPEYQQFFKKLKLHDMSSGELRQSPVLRAHASALMHGITTFLDKIEDKKSLEKLIGENVGRHYGRNVRYEQFKSILHLVPLYLQKTLAHELTADGINGWNKVIDSFCEIFKQQIDILENPDKQALSSSHKDKTFNPTTECCCIS